MKRFDRKLAGFFRFNWYFLCLVLLFAISIFVFFRKSAPVPPTIKASKSDNFVFETKNQNFSAQIGANNSPQPFVSFSSKAGGNISFQMDTKSEKVSLNKTENNVTFKGVSVNTDLVYTTLANGLKETLVIRQPTNHPDEYLFEVITKGASPQRSIEGNPTRYFFNDSGEYQFHLEKPFAIDAGGQRTDDVSLQIKDVSGYKDKYQIILKLPGSWSKSGDRVYPITIDPSIVYDTSVEFSLGILNRIVDIGSGSSPRLETYYQELPVDIHTVGLWHLNESSGSASDSSVNNLTLSASQYNSRIPGVFGLSYNPGLLGNLSCADASCGGITGLDVIGNAWTIEAWIKTSESVASQSIISKAAGSQLGYQLIVTGGYLVAKVTSAAASWSAQRTSFSQISDGNWHHVAMVFKGSTSLDVYVDGKLNNAALTGTIPATVRDTTQGFYISTSDGSADVFLGQIDEVRVSRINRSAEEIRSSASRRPYGVFTSSVIDFGYNVESWNIFSWLPVGVNTGDGETLKNSQSLIAQWNFNETSGTTSDNSETNSSLDLTLNNFSNTSGQDALVGSGWTSTNKRWGSGGIVLSSAATADSLSVANPANNLLDPGSEDLSIEVWLKTFDVSSEILSNNNNNGVSCTGNGYRLGIDANGFPTFYLDTDGATAGCDAQIISSTTKINDGNWHLVTVTVARGSSAKIYVDGVLTGVDSTVTSYSSITVSGTFYFGGSSGGYDGVLDSTRIYSRSLQHAEIVSNNQSNNIEFQTRVGSNSTPDDGDWEAWSPSVNETVIDNFNNPLDYATPSATIYSGTTIATSSSSFPLYEGNLSLKIETGKKNSLNNILGYWNLDQTGGTGAYLVDSTLNANHGTPTGTNVVNGVSSKSRNFNGTSDFVAMGDSPIWDFGTSDFTIEAWVRRTSTGTNDIIVGKDNSPAGTRQFMFMILSTNNLRISYFKSADSQIYLNSSATITDSNWHYVVGQRSGNAFNIYLDGALASTGTTSGTHGTMQSTSANLFIGKREYSGSNDFFSGAIDEVKISNLSVSASEIAENFRLGRDHYITKIISSTDLASANNLTFYVAADRPGTYLSANVGETAYDSYLPDTNTKGLWQFDEVAGSGVSLMDNSGNGNSMSVTGTVASVQGVVGRARNFNNSASNYLSCTDLVCGGTSKLDYAGSGGITLSSWIKRTGTGNGDAIISKHGSVGNYGYYLGINSSNKVTFFTSSNGTLTNNLDSVNTLTDTTLWHHIVAVYDGTNKYLYIDGRLENSSAYSTGIFNTTADFDIGCFNQTTCGSWQFNGLIDEVRVDSVAHTADEIKQAFESGKKSHLITIDFNSAISHTNPLSTVNDLNFTLMATPSGYTNPGDYIYTGDKIIVKENISGVTYLAQGVVDSVNISTGATTVAQWDANSTFPPNGFGPQSTVFKWQKEYWSIKGEVLNSALDAVQILNLRITDGNESRNIWLDDLRSSTGYLSNSSGSAISSSVGNRYLQYRAIFSSFSETNTATLSSVTVFPVLVIPEAPTGLSGTATGPNSIQWDFTDNSSNEAGFKLYDDTGSVQVASNSTPNVNYINETGLSPNTEYVRKVVAYTLSGNSTLSLSSSQYTLASVPEISSVTRTPTVATVTLGLNSNPTSTEFAIYKESGLSCDGSGGGYISANGADNGSTAVWQPYSVWMGSGSVAVTDIDPDTNISFCVKARNSNNIETIFSTSGTNSGSLVPISGDLTIENQSSASLLSRYRDGSDPNRYIIGLDTVGVNEKNSSQLNLNGGSLTVNSNETLVAGKINLSGGSLFLAEGAAIAPGAKLWSIDRDQDGYPDYLGGEVKLWYGQSTPVSTISANYFRRKGSLVSHRVDCDDTINSETNQCCVNYNYYLDTDGDSYGSGTANTLCQFTPVVPDGYVDNNSDCGPGSADAHPGSSFCSTSTFTNAAGNPSYDYDCSNSGGLGSYCGTSIYSRTGYTIDSCNGQNSCTRNGNLGYCIANQASCGGNGYESSGSTASYQDCYPNIGSGSCFVSSGECTVAGAAGTQACN